MRKQSIIILTLAVLFSGFGLKSAAQEQEIIDGAFAREHVPKREEVAFQHIREADAQYSKRVLRMIDLDEKINHPLYFPIRPVDYPGGVQPERSRVSLIHLLYNIGIMNDTEINRQMVFKFDPSDFNNWYRTPITSDDTLGRQNVMTYQEDVQMLDEETGERYWETRDRVIQLRDVKSYLLWEEWVFDRQRSVMDVRIIAMAPVAKFLVESGGVEEIEVQRLFWIPFPQYRSLMARYEVFNPYNDAERRTFDDIFAQRYFESYVIAESNVYDNRFIRDYLLGIDAMYEGQRIEAELFNYEHDLWEY
jgi:gliding motility associated protien GldN